MIGALPTSLNVSGEYYDIDSDFRTVLLIMDMYGDNEISMTNKHLAMLEILFTVNVGGELITNVPHNVEEAIEKATWFLNVGQSPQGKMKPKLDIDGNLQFDSSGNVVMERAPSTPRTLDYKKDEQLLFSAVNAVYTKDVRSEKYLHWWTFYGLCQAIDNESLISSIISLRSKVASGVELDKYEKDFVDENKELVLINNNNEYEAMAAELRSLRGR